LLIRSSFPKVAPLSYGLNGLYAHLRATSDWSGILVILAQAFVLRLAFGTGLAFMLLAVATWVTIAALFRNTRPIVKEKQEEPRTWKNAFANAGVATVLALATLAQHSADVKRVLAVAAIGSLAAALSDTLSHDIGELYGGTPRLITTWRKVRAGESGAVSPLGTAVGVAVAFGFSSVGALCGIIGYRAAVIAGGGACVGNIIDSVLGATLERKGWADNYLVNLGAVLSSSLSVVIFMFWELV